MAGKTLTFKDDNHYASWWSIKLNLIPKSNLHWRKSWWQCRQYMVPNTVLLLELNPTQRNSSKLGAIYWLPRQQINQLVLLRRVHRYQWSWYKALYCILNQMETWTTTRWELEHKSVQYGIEPLRIKSHQALNFKMKCNLLSCFLPDFGIVIDNWTI